MVRRMAVVTGATGTLGRELVHALSSRDVDVLAVSRSGVPPQAGEVASIAADLGQADCVETIRAALPDGDLAMAVHAIGLPPSPGVTEVDPAMLAGAVDLKAGGFLRLLRALDARVTGESRLIAVGGHLGVEPSEHAPLAGVANAALANLVRQLAGPIGRRGATVHLIAPGPFESDRVEALIMARAHGQGISVAEARAQLVDEVPQGRLPQAAEVADIITMLLSPSAAALHGSTLFLDAGARRGIF